MDPTDFRGTPTSLFGLLDFPPWPSPIDIHVTRINEPPIRKGDVSVDLIEHSYGKVWAVTSRRVAPGEELFTDYGPNYGASLLLPRNLSLGTL